MKHTVTITTPPAHSAKCDLWMADEHRDNNGGIKPLGYVDFDVPEALYKNYYVEQRMDEGVLYCRFKDGERFLHRKQSKSICKKISELP